MAEQEWILDTPDGFRIYGLINTSDKQKNDKVILHIHGLGGSWSGYAQTRMAMTFPKHGYDVVRICLYHWAEGGRSLLDCSIQQHAMDIDYVTKHLKRKYTKVFAAGHSYGGPSLMTSKINQFDAVSLWDPTYLPCRSFDKKEYKKSGEFYLSTAGDPSLLSKAFIDESKTYDREKAIALAKKCKAPLQVIYAAYWAKEGESFHTHAKGPTDEKTILSSKHSFFEEGSTEPLLRYTRKWFDQF